MAWPQWQQQKSTLRCSISSSSPETETSPPFQTLRLSYIRFDRRRELSANLDPLPSCSERRLAVVKQRE